jgi:DNA-binding transcriptional ArsR family regulator
MDGFAALADPTRREIVEMLGSGEKDAGTIASKFAISKPAISRHLSVLRESGLVNVRSDAQRRIYSLDLNGLADVDEWLQRQRNLWNERLDALEAALKEKS